MKTTDLFANNRSSKKLNESLQKAFGKSIDLEKFTTEQLEDARNKLRTQIHDVRSNSNFNETVENETLTQAQWMLDAIVSELAERQEFIVDKTGEQVDEVSPPGFAGTVKAMKKHKEVDNPFALAWHMKNKGYKSHKKADGSDKKESVETGEEMTKVTEGEIQQASAIVTAKTMVDRVGRWIEELSGMENDTLLQLGDSIRDEMGSEQAKNFISAVAPAIQQALENLKTTRETLATGVRTLTGEEQGAEMLGSEPGAEEGGDDMAAAAPDEMNMPAEEPAADDFAAAEPAAGGMGDAGREQRESIQFENRLLKVLAG
jgi:hypothetical protein